MKSVFSALLLGAAAAPALAQNAGVSMHAFECGRVVQPDLGRFSDTMQFQGERRELIAGCYLIRHPKGVLLWDTGITPDLIEAMKASTMTPGTSIADRLRTLGLAPDAVTYVGISHYHPDHTSGAKAFPKSELLIGKGDWEAVQALKPTDLPAVQLAPWLSVGGKVSPVSGDKDVFGDGSVMMLAMQGHTPGHTALLVKLASGPILLSGDQYHFRENRAARGVPTFNWNRADTLASHDRLETIARNLKARVVIQHDPRDMAELPAFPAAIR